MGKRYTVKEFAQLTGKSEEYVRQCCRGQISNGKPLQLPPGHRALPKSSHREPWTIERITVDGSMDFQNSDAFEEQRISVIAELLEISNTANSDKKATARALLKAIPELLRNSEVADLLSNRWKHDLLFETMSDLMTHGRRIGSPSSPQQLDMLLRKLSACFRAAAIERPRSGKVESAILGRLDGFVTSAGMGRLLPPDDEGTAKQGRKISVTLDFFSNGEIAVNGYQIKHDAALRKFLEDADWSPGKDDLADIYKLVWYIQIHELRSSGQNDGIRSYADQILKRDIVQMHHAYDLIITRCLHCGKLLPSNSVDGRRRRSHRHHCSDNHRVAHNKWLDSLRVLNKENRINKIASQLMIVLNNQSIS